MWESKLISLLKERSCCEICPVVLSYSSVAERPGKTIIILLVRKWCLLQGAKKCQAVELTSLQLAGINWPNNYQEKSQNTAVRMKKRLPCITAFSATKLMQLIALVLLCKLSCVIWEYITCSWKSQHINHMMAPFQIP